VDPRKKEQGYGRACSVISIRNRRISRRKRRELDAAEGEDRPEASRNDATVIELAVKYQLHLD
jgi:hypothetical protein